MRDKSKEAIESIGFSVVATTKHKDGISFDAHREVGRRILVHGPVEDTHDEAMLGLYVACLERRI